MKTGSMPSSGWHRDSTAAATHRGRDLHGLHADCHVWRYDAYLDLCITETNYYMGNFLYENEDLSMAPPQHGNPHKDSKSSVTVLVTRNFTKSDEFFENSARILCGFCRASVQLTAELQYYYRGECLPFPWNDTSLSVKLTSSFFVEHLYCIRIWCTS